MEEEDDNLCKRQRSIALNLRRDTWLGYVVLKHNQTEKEKQLLTPAILWKSRFAETGFALAVSC